MIKIDICKDEVKWNESILRLGGSLYQSWRWGELRSTEGHKLWRILGTDEGEARAAVQIVERSLPIVGKTVMYAPQGIAASLQDVEAINELTIWLRRLLRERRAILLRIDPMMLDTNEAAKHAFTNAGYRWLPNQQWSVWTLPRAMMVIDVAPPEEQILRNMRADHRQNIRRAARNHVVVELGIEFAQLKELHRLLLKTGQRQRIAVRDLEYYREVCKWLLSDENGIIVIAKTNGQAIAAILCARFGESCYYLAGGFDWEQRQAHVTEAVHWRAIQWAKQMGCKEYNLLGANTRYPPEKDKASGVYSFKAGFGAELRYHAGYFDLTEKPITYRAFRVAENNVGRLASKMLHESLLGHDLRRFLHRVHQCFGRRAQALAKGSTTD